MLNGSVQAITTWNGALVACGSFSGGGFDRVAMRTGTNWQPIPGMPGTQAVLRATSWNGNLVVVDSQNTISVWNGTAWTTLPARPGVTQVYCLTAFQGLLCVGGTGNGTGGAIDRWNGTSWLPSTAANDTVRCFAVRSFQLNSTLYTGGEFTTIGGAAAARIASTSSGATFLWNAVGTGLPSTCSVLHARATSAFGTAIVASTAGNGVQQWNGSSFVPMGTAPLLITLEYHAGAYHGALAATPICARYDGTAWSPVVGLSIDGEVRALARNGADTVVGGSFQSVANPTLNRIATWNGTTFQPLGSGIAGTSVDALLRRGAGELVAGGSFTTAGGTATSNIAKWSGSAWSALGSGTNDQVLALCELPNGDVIAGGRFTMAGGVACSRIARWNGVAWSTLNFGMNADVLAVAVRNDGTLFAAGSFTAAGANSCNRVARWSGTSWQPLGSGCDGDVRAIAFRANGDLVAVGAFHTAGGVAADRCAVWNGTAWAATGSSSGDPNPARSVFVLPNDDVVVGRGFHQPGVTPDSGVSRWNGAAWSGFDPGVASATVGTAVNVRALLQRADGALIVGGDFGFADGLTARGLALLTSTCPASATTYGAGCSSGAGLLSIAANTLPWIGSTFRTATTGVASNSVCLGVIGLAQLSIPLPAVLPEGQPGCSLLTTVDILLLLANGPGNTATSSFALTNDPALIGVPFFQQTIPLEFDLTGAVVAARGSNALSLVIGTF